MTLKVKLRIFLLSVASLSLLWRSDFTQRLQLRYNDICPCEVCFSSHHTLLNHHLRRSVKPFLSANTSVSEETFQWWKRLQKEKHNFTYFKSTLDKLFKIISPIPDLIKLSPDKCRTCAVVGNSVNLKGSHYGPLIDFQDIVIRMNYAKTKGYEEDVGTRTTHHVMYPESAVDLDNSTHLVLFPFKVLDLEWVMKAITTRFYGRSYAPVKTKIKANKDLVMVLNPAFMRYVYEIWLKKKGNYPSTGFMAFIFALHICDEDKEPERESSKVQTQNKEPERESSKVHVFGYGADHDGNWSHYFEGLRNKKLKTGQHPGQQEYAIIQQLAKEKTITFYKRS